MISSLLHHENECQLSVTNFWSWTLGNHGIAQMFELITELLTAFMSKNTSCKRKKLGFLNNRFRKLQNMQKGLLDIEYVILVSYCYHSANTRALYECTDGPPGQPSGNLLDSDGWGNIHRTIPELTVWVYWRPCQPIWNQCCLYQDPDAKWHSATVANTNCN